MITITDGAATAARSALVRDICRRNTLLHLVPQRWWGGSCVRHAIEERAAGLAALQELAPYLVDWVAGEVNESDLEKAGE